MEGLALSAVQAETAPERSVLPVAALAGFFFVFRAALTFLFFQTNPVAGTAMTVIAGLVLVFGALLCTAGGAANIARPTLRNVTLMWIAAFLAVSFVSLAWGEAQSPVAAFAYWAALASDVIAVSLLLCGGALTEAAMRLMAGAVWGGVALSLIAWCAPATEDLRLGNDAFLHPNTLGLEIGLCALMAQYLSRRGAIWKWIAIGLALTLLRTLSKTAILAFLAAEAWYLLQSRQWTRTIRIRIAATALVVIASFWGMLSAYFELYAGSQGRQLETLTGRTLLWAVVLSMAFEKPWFGHGFYSFKSLVPSLGEFVPVHAHNELLHQFFELGAVGAAIVIGIYAAFLMRAWRSTRSELRTLAIALWIFAVVRGLTDAVSAELCFPLWLMAALAMCLDLTHEKVSIRR